jgi:lauroyl/myristoyl acyltransferase
VLSYFPVWGYLRVSKPLVGEPGRQRSPYRQVHRRRPVSLSDVTYVLGSLLMRGMQAIPTSRRTQAINEVSPFLARLLYTANIHPTRTIRKNLNAVFIPERPHDAVEADIRRSLSMIIWNSLISNTLPVLPHEQIIDLVPVDGITYLDDCLASGYAVLIWSYHFGVTPMVITAMLHTRGYPVHVLTHVGQRVATANILQLSYFLQLQPSADRFSVIDPQEGIRPKMLDVLRNKECLYGRPSAGKETQSPSRHSAFYTNRWI